jgi:hypothetical protein
LALDAQQINNGFSSQNGETSVKKLMKAYQNRTNDAMHRKVLASHAQQRSARRALLISHHPDKTKDRSAAMRNFKF